METPFELEKLAPTGVCHIDTERVYTCSRLVGRRIDGDGEGRLPARSLRHRSVQIASGFSPFDFKGFVARRQHGLYFNTDRLRLCPLLRRIASVEITDERLRLRTACNVRI